MAELLKYPSMNKYNIMYVRETIAQWKIFMGSNFADGQSSKFPQFNFHRHMQSHHYIIIQSRIVGCP